MTDPSDAYPKPNPVEAFETTIAERQTELEFLSDGLREGMEVVSDLDRVNETLAASSRPDLVITERVQVMEVNNLDGLARVNNFFPNLSGFGPRVYEDERNTVTGEVRSKCVGRRQPTEEEIGVFFFLGARGDYDGYKAFAEEHRLDEDEVIDTMLQTHVGKEAFMRMWILFPELTRTIMASCLDEVGRRNRSWGHTDAEAFVAYNLMAQLVDINDKYVIRNGEVDTWVLCR